MHIILIALLLTSYAPAISPQYKIEGYRKAEVKDGKKILMEADSSQGLQNIGFEELQKVKITVNDGTYQIQFKADKALYKNEEVILSKSAEVKLHNTKGKLLLTVKSHKPDDLIYYNTAKNTITVPAYLFVMKGQTIRGRSLIVNLNARSLNFVQPLKDKSFTPPTHF